MRPVEGGGGKVCGGHRGGGRCSGVMRGSSVSDGGRSRLYRAEPSVSVGDIAGRVVDITTGVVCRRPHPRRHILRPRSPPSRSYIRVLRLLVPPQVNLALLRNETKLIHRTCQISCPPLLLYSPGSSSRTVRS